jgi:hypothetical protein
MKGLTAFLTTDLEKNPDTPDNIENKIWIPPRTLKKKIRKIQSK